MNSRDNDKTLAKLIVFLSVALFVLALAGCTSTAPGTATTGPGSPDEAQTQHYDMAMSGIVAKSKDDALPALALLQADAYRWQTNTWTLEAAMARLSAVTFAVDKGDWPLANKLMLDLKSRYGRP